MQWLLFLPLLAEIEPPADFPQPLISAELITAIGRSLFAFWLFAVGASVGSFLNVVVYRLPAGMNLGSPASRCPRCRHPIRWQHNIPILGWLILGGRCADCQLPISKRYPLVETLLGLLFLLVGGVELIGNGLNFPPPLEAAIRPALAVNQPWPLGAAVLLHLMLLTTLIGAALIDYDRQAIPSRLITPVIATTAAASLVWPMIHPVPAVHPDFLRTSKLDVFLRGPAAGLIDLTAGAAAGLAAAMVIYLATRSRPWLERRYGGPVTLMWIAIGLVFGWQLVPWLLACWAVHYWLSVSRRLDLIAQPLLPARGLAIVALVTLLAWRIVADYAQILDDSPASQAVIYCTMVAAAGILLRASARRLPVEYVFPEPVAETVLPPPTEPLSADELTPP